MEIRRSVNEYEQPSRKKERVRSQSDPVEGKEEDRGRTLPSGAPVEFSPKVETARVSDRDGKMDRRRRGGSREGKNT